MTIKQLQKLCHKIAVKKGFWNCPFCALDSEIWSCHVCDDTGKYRNDGEMIALMHSELSEMLEDIRKGNWKHAGEELADFFIRGMDIAEGRNIDLQKEIMRKIKINKKRPYKHGKKF